MDCSSDTLLSLLYRCGVREAVQSWLILWTSNRWTPRLSRGLYLSWRIPFLQLLQTAVRWWQIKDNSIKTGTSWIWMDFINNPLTLPTAVHFPTIVQPTALSWNHVKGVPCLSTPVGSGDPKTAAVACVRGAPIVHICPRSYNASNVHWVTFAPQVSQFIPQHVQSIVV